MGDVNIKPFRDWAFNEAERIRIEKITHNLDPEPEPEVELAIPEPPKPPKPSTFITIHSGCRPSIELQKLNTSESWFSRCPRAFVRTTINDIMGDIKSLKDEK